MERTVLTCPACSHRYRPHPYDSTQTYQCKNCGGILAPDPDRQSPVRKPDPVRVLERNAYEIQFAQESEDSRSKSRRSLLPPPSPPHESPKSPAKALERTPRTRPALPRRFPRPWSWAAVALALAAAGIVAIRATDLRKAAQTEAQRARQSEAQARRLAEDRRRQVEKSSLDAAQALGRAELSQAERRQGTLRLAECLVELGDSLANLNKWGEAYVRGYRPAEILYRDLGARSASLSRGLAQTHLHQPPPLIRFAGHPSAITALAFSPDGSQIASAGLDGSLAIWETFTGRQLCLFTTPCRVVCLSYSRTGNHLAFGSESGMLGIWDIAIGQERWSRILDGGPRRSVEFSENGTRLLSAGQDGSIDLTESRSGEVLTSWAVGGALTRAQYLEDDQALYWREADGACRRLDLRTGEAWGGCGGVLPGGPRILCALSPAGRWSLSEARHIAQAMGEAVGSPGPSEWEALECSISPDGHLAVSPGPEGSVKVWDTGLGREIRSYDWQPEGTTSAVFSPDGRFVLSGGTGGSLHLWEVCVPPMEASLTGRFIEFGSRMGTGDGKRPGTPGESPDLQVLSEWWGYRGFPDVSSTVEALGNALKKSPPGGEEFGPEEPSAQGRGN